MLEQQIQEDIKAAMKAKDTVALAATRAIKGEILPGAALLPYDSNSLTAAEMVRPSDCPARALLAMPMTFPMSILAQKGRSPS